MKATFRKTSLALAVMTAICSVGAIGAANAAASANNALVTVAHTTVLHKGDAVIGALSMAQPIHVEVALKMRDRAGLDAFIVNAAKNSAGSVAQPMSAGQFMANHAPSQVDAQTVANYLTRMGYKNVTIAPNRLLISADGTAATARNAFLTSFSQVRTHDGRIAYANTDDVRIPALLQDKVLAVMGLQTVHMMHTFAKVISPKSGHTNAIVGHNPMEFSSIYGGTGVATAAGVTVGIFTNGDVSQSITDLNAFTAANHLATVPTSVVTVGTPTTGTGGVIEWDLDSQDIVGMGGGQVGNIIFYNVPTLSDSDMNSGFNKIVTDNVAKIINVSIGGCETGTGPAPLGDNAAAAADQIFALGVTQGQTFSISTGDSGADECGNGGTTPSWPANSPYVIAAAGTTLDASTTTWNSETVWSGSGGSASLYEPKPYWQSVLVSGNFRGVADIAFDADPNSGSIVTTSSGPQQVGGTSLSAPIFSGMWARVLAVKGTGFGFAGPLLYLLPQSDFHDITSGSNGIPAGVGYDLASGRGSMILNSAIHHIGPVGTPPVANFSYVQTGAVVNFTDTSTVTSPATLISHNWTFGDSKGSSTATNPSYTYTCPGTYNVSEGVADSNFNLSTKTKAVTYALNPTGQLLVNTGFENGTTGWSFSSSGLLTQVNPHCGLWAVKLDGTGKAHTDTVSQQVTIPNGKTSATLSYWLHIDTTEVATNRKFDVMTVSANPVINNIGLAPRVVVSCPVPAVTYSNLDKNTGYVLKTMDLTPCIGQTVNLTFSGKEDASLATSFVIDDVTLYVH